MHAIHGDLSAPARADTETMSWTPSPSGTVWRKRVHLVGPPESGQVTSVVRYEPDSTFAAHDHPEGEEILVLDGVFSDEHGDWPAGTYLLNPEGFRHAPFSKPGCTLFVKLRQFPGRERRHVVLATRALAWQPTAQRGVAAKLLYAQSGFSDVMKLERLDPDADAGDREYPDGAELFVLEGAFSDASGEHGRGTWLRFPRGAKHHPRSAAGCTWYVKTGGLRYLRAGE
jgi:anti-sigma factor ChrR (cupin superfamily)